MVYRGLYEYTTKRPYERRRESKFDFETEKNSKEKVVKFIRNTRRNLQNRNQ